VGKTLTSVAIAVEKLGPPPAAALILNTALEWPIFLHNFLPHNIHRQKLTN